MAQISTVPPNAYVVSSGLEQRLNLGGCKAPSDGEGQALHGLTAGRMAIKMAVFSR